MQWEFNFLIFEKEDSRLSLEVDYKLEKQPLIKLNFYKKSDSNKFDWSW